MPRWNVEGADARTGHDRVVTVEAHSQKEAEQAARKMGLVVSEVYQAVTKTPAEALDEMVGSAINTPTATAPPHAAAVPEASKVVQYRSPGSEAGPVPAYGGLKLGSSLLSVFALLYYVLAAVIIVAGLLSISASAATGWSGEAAVAAIGALAMGLTAAMVGVVLHAVSAACLALRDIARNSFK